MTRETKQGLPLWQEVIFYVAIIAIAYILFVFDPSKGSPV